MSEPTRLPRWLNRNPPDPLLGGSQAMLKADPRSQRAVVRAEQAAKLRAGSE